MFGWIKESAVYEVGYISNDSWDEETSSYKVDIPEAVLFEASTVIEKGYLFLIHGTIEASDGTTEIFLQANKLEKQSTDDGIVIFIGFADGSTLTERLLTIPYSEEGSGGIQNIWDSTGTGAVAGGNPEEAVSSGNNSFAFGYSPKVTGNNSLAFGYNPQVSGMNSTAFGYGHIVNGNNCFVIGMSNSVPQDGQFVFIFGRYSKFLTGMLEIVGNGWSPVNPTNARTLDVDGNEWLAGQIQPENGIRLKAPNGTYYNVTVDNNGALSITAVT